jgi:Tfp pilus assembly protein PilN
MLNTKLQAARELIREKRYSEARAILKTMENDPTAIKWLAQLDKLAPVKRRSISVIGIALVAVILLAIVGVALFTINAINTQRRQSDLILTQVVDSAHQIATQNMLAIQANYETVTTIAQINQTQEIASLLIQTSQAENFIKTLTALVPTLTNTSTSTQAPSATNTSTQTMTPSITFTPSITLTPPPTLTITPTYSPAPTKTLSPSPTLLPTVIPPLGTRNNPVPKTFPFRFGGLGVLSIQSQWQPGQTGLAIVHLTFSCERPSDQVCDTGNFMLDVAGSSGTVYERVFEIGIPEPTFGSFMNPEVYGGGNISGYAGFLITSPENSLQLRVRLFLQEGEVFFSL